MPNYTLSNIITKTRKLTSSGNSLQLTDTMITDYINSFYSYDLPAQFRSLKLKDKYTFNTVKGQDTYPFDSEHYTTVGMPCYCAKREIKLFNDPWSFYGVNFNWQNQEVFTFGAGNPGPYTGFTQATPLLASINNDPGTLAAPNLNYPQSRVQNILITAQGTSSTVNITDDGNGNLIEILSTQTNTSSPSQGNFNQLYYRNIVGTISYTTGQITIQSGLGNGSVPISQSIVAGQPLTIDYNPIIESIPLSIMFYQNQFVLRPVPDAGYTIELTAYRQPTQALIQTAGQEGNPELNEWWELLAVGAAKKIYEDRQDMMSVAMMDKMLQERYAIAMSRTYADIGQRRINTIFADQLSYNYGSGGFFSSGSGSGT